MDKRWTNECHRFFLNFKFGGANFTDLGWRFGDVPREERSPREGTQEGRPQGRAGVPHGCVRRAVRLGYVPPLSIFSRKWTRRIIRRSANSARPATARRTGRLWRAFGPGSGCGTGGWIGWRSPSTSAVALSGRSIPFSTAGWGETTAGSPSG